MIDSPLRLVAPDVAERVEADVAGGRLIAYTCPEPGKTTGNEDCVSVIPYGPEAAVMVIADGAGGMPAGRRASQTAVESLERSLLAARDETLLLRSAILNGIESANTDVMALGSGSATTLTIVTVEARTARTYQVGDSEALVIGQRGRIRAQTMAHSPTGFAIEAGLLDQRDALHHEERHLVSNFIGTPEMRIEIGPGVDLHHFDTVLLASDGLMDNVHLDEITDLARKGPLGQASDALSALAGRRMTASEPHQPSKPDDLSLILFRKPLRTRSTKATATE